MSVTAAQVMVKIGGDSSEAEKSLDNVGHKVHGVQGFFGNALSTMAGFIGGQAIFSAVGTGVGFLKDQLGESINVAEQFQQAQAQTAAALKSTGDSSGMSAAGIAGLADQYSRMTPFSALAIQQAENMTLSFQNIGKNIFPQATMAAMNLATRMGIDLPAATKMVDRALNDPAKSLGALTRAGVQFTVEQTKQIKAMEKAGNLAGAQAIVMNALKEKFGGAAQAAGSTFAGALDILQNQLENLRVKVGTAILPLLVDLLHAVMPIAQALSGVLATNISIVASLFQSAIVPAVTALMPLFGALFQTIESIGQSFMEGLKPALDAIHHGFRAIKGPAIDVKGLFAEMERALHPLAGVALQFGRFLGDLVTHVMGLIGPLGDMSSATSGLAGVFGIVGDYVHLQLQYYEDLGSIIGTYVVPIIEDLVGIVGEHIVPAFMQFAGFLTSVVMPAIVQLAGFVQAVLLTVIKDLGNFIITTVVPIISELATVFQQDVMPAVEKVATAVITQLIPPIERLTSEILPVLGPILSVIGDILRAVLGPALQVVGWIVGNVVGPALTILIDILGGAITAIVDVVAVIIGFIGILGSVKTSLGNLLGTIGNFVGNALGALGNFFGTIIGGFANLELTAISKIEALASGILSTLAGLPAKMLAFGAQLIQSLIQGITSQAGNLANNVKSTIDNIPGIGGLASSIPGFAAGGTMASTGIALVGESGPEVVQLPGGAQVMPISQVGTPQALPSAQNSSASSSQQMVMQIDGMTIARAVVPYIAQQIRSNAAIQVQ